MNPEASMAYSPTSPFFPVPNVSTPLDTALIRFMHKPFHTRAGNILGNGPAANVAVTTNGVLSYDSQRIGGLLGNRTSVHKAGDWWLVLASDGTGVFLDQSPHALRSRWVEVAPVAVRWGRKARIGGIARSLGWNDLHDAMENPDLPNGFGEAVRDALALEINAWGEACAQAPRIDPKRSPVEGAHPDGRIPGWFLPNSAWTDLDKAKITRLCDTLATGIATTINSTHRQVTVMVQGACVDGLGVFHDARFIVASQDAAADKVWMDTLDAARDRLFDWWPQERRVAPYKREGSSATAVEGSTHKKMTHLQAFHALLQSEEVQGAA
jgi:hypothetical protein